MKKKQLLAIVMSTSMFLSTSLGTVSFAKEEVKTSVVQEETMEDDDSNVAAEGAEGSDNSEMNLTANAQETGAEKEEVYANASKDGVEDVSKTSENEKETNETEAKEETTVAVQSDEEVKPAVEGTEIYLDSVSGSDTNDGSSETLAVQNIKRAMELAGEGGTIIVTGNGSVWITEDVTLENNITIKRGANLSNRAALISIENGANVTIDSATIDGGKNELPIASSLNEMIKILDSTLTINDGAKICNGGSRGIRVNAQNKDAGVIMNGGEICNMGSEDDQTPSQHAIEIAARAGKATATFTMNGGSIHDNLTSGTTIFMTGSGSSVEDMDVFNMKGGSIKNNKIRANTDLDTDYHGAISIRVGTFNMSGGEISNNAGGGIIAEDDPSVQANITGGTISGNTADYGGGIRIWSGARVNISGGTISGNSVKYGGGGIINCDGTVNITGGTIAENTAEYGAGILVENGTTTIGGTTLISKNRTADDGGGGGIAVNGGAVKVTGGTIAENTACYGGGIASWYEGVVTVEGDARIMKNKAVGSGGGGITAAAKTLTLNGGIISENEAPYGAAIGIWGDAKAVMSGDTQITGNKVLTENGNEHGGAVYVGGFNNDGCTFTMKGGSITNNTTDKVYCAGIAVNGNKTGGIVEISGGTIAGNTNAQGIKQGIRLYKGTNTEGVNKDGQVKLSGSPDIADEIYLNDYENNEAKVEVTDAFTPKQAVPVNDSSWTNYRTIVTYATGLTAKTDDFTPASGSVRRTIIKDADDAQNLQSLNKLFVTFCEEDGSTTYGELYVLPKERISKDLIPEAKKDGCTLLGWKEKQADKNWDFATDTVTVDTVLYPAWRVDKVIRQVTIKDGDQEYGTVDVEKNQTIEADKLPKLTKPGYDFMGWETADGKAWDIENDRVTSNIELHPIWKLKNATGNIEADNAKDGKVTVHTGESVVLTATANHEAEGDISYQFTWFKDGKELTAQSKGRAVAEQNTLEVTEAGTYSVKVVVSDGTQTTEAVEIDTMEVAVEDHDFGEWVIIKQPTETEKGLKERICKTCGVKETAEIPATGKKEDPKPDPEDPKPTPEDPKPNPDDKKDDSKSETDKKKDAVTTKTTVEKVTANTVQTGDVNPLGFAVGAMVLAVGVGAGTVLRRKKHF